MKTLNHRTLILAGGILAFAGSLWAEDLPVEQRLDQDRISCRAPRQRPDSCEVGMVIDIPYGAIKRNETMDIALELANGPQNSSVSLGSLLLQTGRESNRETRRLRRQGIEPKAPEVCSKYGKKRPILLSYSCTIPKEEWMSSATHVAVSENLSKKGKPLGNRKSEIQVSDIYNL